MTNKEIEEQLAKEFNRPVSLINLVINNFWIAFKKAINNPIDSKGRIIIPLLGTFFIKENSIDRALNGVWIKQQEDENLKNNIIEFYKQLKTVLEQNERQTRKKV